MRHHYLLLVSSLLLASSSVGCAEDEELKDTTGSADTGGGVSLDAEAPDTTVPDTGAPDTAEPDTTVPDTTVPDTTPPPDTLVADTGVFIDTGFPFDTAIDTTVPDGFVPPECTTASDCPFADLECAKKACVAGKCAVNFIPKGTLTGPQDMGDCKRRECNGTGLAVFVADGTDTPVSTNECVSPTCDGTTPSTTPKPARTACTTGGVLCDGAGKCVTCLAPTDCPKPTNPCVMATCTAGTCGTAFVPDLTKLVGVGADGDCRATACNGAGGTKIVYEPLDPKNDGRDCTTDTCHPTAPPDSDFTGPYTSHTSKPAGTLCDRGANTCKNYSTEGGSLSVCGECDVADDCYWTADIGYDYCEVPTCINHKCGKTAGNEGGSCWTFGSGYCNGTCKAGVCSDLMCESWK